MTSGFPEREQVWIAGSLRADTHFDSPISGVWRMAFLSTFHSSFNHETGTILSLDGSAIRRFSSKFMVTIVFEPVKHRMNNCFTMITFGILNNPLWYVMKVSCIVKEKLITFSGDVEAKTISSWNFEIARNRLCGLMKVMLFLFMSSWYVPSRCNVILQFRPRCNPCWQTVRVYNLVSTYITIRNYFISDRRNNEQHVTSGHEMTAKRRFKAWEHNIVWIYEKSSLPLAFNNFVQMTLHRSHRTPWIMSFGIVPEEFGAPARPYFKWHRLLKLV